MIKRKKVYCEWDFLKNFVNSVPRHRPDTLQQFISWNNLYFFISKADLVINVSEKEFWMFSDNNEWLLDLYKKFNQGELKNIFNKEQFVSISDLGTRNLEDTYLNAVYLTCFDDDFCKEVSKNFGILALNLNMAYQCNHLYIDNGTSFPRLTAVNWNFLNDLNMLFPQLKNCNAMIIVDNFLFSDTNLFTCEDKVEYNLRPILDYLLPERLKEGLEFKLTILTGKKEELYKVVYDKLCSIIEDIRPNLNCVTTMYNDSSSIFHDRSIATNYVWIDCGSGFDVVKEGKNLNKSTKVTVAFPLIQDTMEPLNRSFIQFVNDVKERIRYRPKRNQYGQFSWGNGDSSNRIVSYYTKDENRRESIPSTPIRATKNRFDRSYAW